MRRLGLLNVVVAALWCSLYFGLTPSRAPLLDVLFAAVAILFALGGIGWWRGGVWGRRLALIGACAALAWALVMIGALVSAAAYLHGIFGSIGTAASAVAVLAAVLVAFLIGLLPLYQWVALRGVTGRSLWVLLACLVVVMAVSYLALWHRYRISENERWTPAQATRALRVLRGRAPPPTDALGQRRLWVTVYRDGDAQERRFGTLSALQAGQSAVALQSGRLKLDIELDRGPVFRAGLIGAMAFVPGLDGVIADVAGREEILLPDDLLKLNAFAGVQLAADLRVGLDLEAVRQELVRKHGDDVDWGRARLRRVRTQGFLEPDVDATAAASLARTDAVAIPVRRGVRLEMSPQEPTRAGVRDAALQAAAYLARQTQETGQFRYLYDPYRDVDIPGRYSLPRHAGTTWFLAQAFRISNDNALRAALERAVDFMAKSMQFAKQRAFFAEKGAKRASLGSAALAAVALTEYREATGSPRHDALLRGLDAFLRAQQLPNGDFAHSFDVRRRQPNARRKQPYFSGEAAYALARIDRIWPDAERRAAMQRALDWLTAGEYRYIAGQYFIGDDHWTCYAAQAAFPVVASRNYVQFCRDFVRYQRRMQFRRDESAAAADFAGSYGITPFLTPHSTPAASRTEAALACLPLLRASGDEVTQLEKQIDLSVRFLLRTQIGTDDYLVRKPSLARGGWRESLASSPVRIDYVQHAGAALLAAAELIYR